LKGEVLQRVVFTFLFCESLSEITFQYTGYVSGAMAATLYAAEFSSWWQCLDR
jgi:hypothetical protein